MYDGKRYKHKKQWLIQNITTIMWVGIYLCTCDVVHSHLAEMCQSVFLEACTPHARGDHLQRQKWGNFFHWARQGKNYLLFFYWSWISNTLLSGHEMQDLVSISVTLPSLMVSDWRCHRWRVWKSLWIPVAYSEVNMYLNISIREVISKQQFYIFLTGPIKHINKKYQHTQKWLVKEVFVIKDLLEMLLSNI